MRETSLEAPVGGRAPLGTLSGVLAPSAAAMLGAAFFRDLSSFEAVLGVPVLIALLFVVAMPSFLLAPAWIRLFAETHEARAGAPGLGSIFAVVAVPTRGALSVLVYAFLSLNAGTQIRACGERLAQIALDAGVYDGDPYLLRVELRVAVWLAIVLLTRFFALGLKTIWPLALALLVFGLAQLLGPPASVAHASLPQQPFRSALALLVPIGAGYLSAFAHSGELAHPRRSLTVGLVLTALLVGFVYLSHFAFVALGRPRIELPGAGGFDVAVYSAGQVAAAIALGFSAWVQVLGASRLFERLVPRHLVARGLSKRRMAFLAWLGALSIGLAGALFPVPLRLPAQLALLAFVVLSGLAGPFGPVEGRVRPLPSALGGLLALALMLWLSVPGAIFAAALFTVTFVALRPRRGQRRGEAWQRMWQSWVRFGLLRLGSRFVGRIQGRSFRPNLLVVAEDRPQNELIQLAEGIAGRRGLVTHFVLKPDGPRRPAPDEEVERDHPGVFGRVLGSSSSADTIPSLAATFGLAGMEPNAVVLNWPRAPEAKEAFGGMLGRLLDLDVHVFALRYDPARGFGRRERIDVWWDGRENSGTLLLAVVERLTQHPLWKNAEARVLVVAEPDWDMEAARRLFDGLIRDTRFSRLEPVLLPPLAEDQVLRDRVRQESAHADLVLFALLPLKLGPLETFVDRATQCFSPIGSTVLVWAQRRNFDTRILFRDRGRAAHKTAVAQPFAFTLPGAPELEEPLGRLEARLSRALDRFEKDVAAVLTREDAELIGRFGQEVAHLKLPERKSGERSLRRSVIRGQIELARRRFGEFRVRSIRAFTATDTVDESAWEKRAREGAGELWTEVEESFRALPQAVTLPTTAADWASAPTDSLRLALWKRLVRLGLSFGRPPPARRLALRQLAELALGPSLAEAIEAAQVRLGVRRLDAMRRLRRLGTDFDHNLRLLEGEIEAMTERPAGRAAVQSRFRHEMETLADLADAARARVTDEAETVRTELAASWKRDAELWMKELGALEFGDLPRLRRVAERELGQVRERLFDAARLYRLQHQAWALAIELDVSVAALVEDARAAVLQLYHRVRRDFEQGPTQALDAASAIMTRVLGFFAKPEERVDVSEAASDEVAERTQRAMFTAAAEELRGVWERSLKPEPREWIDQLLVQLGRASERLPEEVRTLREAELDLALEGEPKASLSAFPARRLAQNFLEELIAEEARRGMERLPEVFEQSQNVLVDASRLVAYELEHALDDGVPEDGVETSLLVESDLVATLEECLSTIAKAKANIAAYLEELRAGLVDRSLRELDEARDAIVGESATRRMERASTELAERVDEAVRRTRAFATQTWREIELLRRRRTPDPNRSLTEDLLLAREQLDPYSEVQSRLPLPYRRAFGRAPLDAPALAGGRDFEIETARALGARWQAGHGGPIAFVGEPRSGRSSLAKIMIGDAFDKRPFFRLMPPAGGAGTLEEMNDVVRRALSAREGQSAEGALRALPPGAVLFLDDLARWVERTPRGLQVLEVWMRIWSHLGERHLFVVTATPWVWRYADRLMGLSERFLGVVTAGGLSPGALRELVLLRQRTSGLGLSFADEEHPRFLDRWTSLHAVQFRRLHQRSGGNIGDALELWRRSIRDVGSNRVVVSIGKDPETIEATLARLPLRWVVALLALLFHRSVSASRLQRILRLGRDETLNLVGDLERAGLASSDAAHVYSVDPMLQPYLVRSFRERGLLG